MQNAPVAAFQADSQKALTLRFARPPVAMPPSLSVPAPGRSEHQAGYRDQSSRIRHGYHLHLAAVTPSPDDDDQHNDDRINEAPEDLQTSSYTLFCLPTHEEQLPMLSDLLQRP